jgi:hypothetical protein
MIARWGGRCPVCGNPIVKGATVEPIQGTRKVKHPGCVAPDPAVVAQVRAGGQRLILTSLRVQQALEEGAAWPEAPRPDGGEWLPIRPGVGFLIHGDWLYYVHGPNARRRPLGDDLARQVRSMWNEYQEARK